MKLPFVRRATADALRTQLARAEKTVVAQAASVEARDGEVRRLTSELNDARLARKAALYAYEIANSRADRAEDQVVELEARLRAAQVQPDEGEAGTAGPRMGDKDYAFALLNLVFPQFADVIARNDGVLPDDHYEALSNYVNSAPQYGLSEAEVEELRVQHGLPAPIFQRAKDFAPRAGAV
ncbi:hypothetical protein ABZZ79_28955 [Streptomyces sp. NPDC006458]|uniref:hypothetical protein n=1 Tax=Streptomyces sp. NPDC006458 TaxID=3154302 RepID=UPI0033B37D1E